MHVQPGQRIVGVPILGEFFHFKFRNLDCILNLATIQERIPHGDQCLFVRRKVAGICRLELLVGTDCPWGSGLRFGDQQHGRGADSRPVGSDEFFPAKLRRDSLDQMLPEENAVCGICHDHRSLSGTPEHIEHGLEAFVIPNVPK